MSTCPNDRESSVNLHVFFLLDLKGSHSLKRRTSWDRGQRFISVGRCYMWNETGLLLVATLRGACDLALPKVLVTVQAFDKSQSVHVGPRIAFI